MAVDKHCANCYYTPSQFDKRGKRILSPVERAEQRFLRGYDVTGEEAAADFADVDQTVDRYDYLIVFPNPPKASSLGSRGGGGAGGYQAEDEEQPGGEEVELLRGRRVADVEDEESLMRRIKKHEICDIWYSAVPGDEVLKNAAQVRRGADGRTCTTESLIHPQLARSPVHTRISCGRSSSPFFGQGMLLSKAAWRQMKSAFFTTSGSTWPETLW
jgi:hypothetical protein